MTDIDILRSDSAALRSALAGASNQQLQQALQLLIQQIEERRHQREQSQLAHKGKRVLSDMRSLMAKAGVSMDELQSVLPK